MRKCLMVLLLGVLLIIPIHADEPEMPEVPEAAQECMPRSYDSFTQGVVSVLKKAAEMVAPEIRESGLVCLSVLGVVIACSIIRTPERGGLSGSGLVGVAAIGAVLLRQTHGFLQMGITTAEEISQYSGLMLPAMSAAMVSSGGVTKATALYMGTAFCNGVLTRLMTNIIPPLVYIFIAVSIASAAISNELLKKTGLFFKGCITWCLKIVLYVFTGYMTITGVVSGITDAAALKATKLAISGVVPVVGGILSDASEAVLVGASAVRSSLGVGGLLVVLSITAVPFLKVAIQSVLLKLTSAWCGAVGDGCHSDLVQSFAQAMELVLAMVGTSCLIQLISVVCFLKGVG